MKKIICLFVGLGLTGVAYAQETSRVDVKKLNTAMLKLNYFKTAVDQGYLKYLETGHMAASTNQTIAKLSEYNKYIKKNDSRHAGSAMAGTGLSLGCFYELLQKVTDWKPGKGLGGLKKTMVDYFKALEVHQREVIIMDLMQNRRFFNMRYYEYKPGPMSMYINSDKSFFQILKTFPEIKNLVTILESTPPSAKTGAYDNVLRSLDSWLETQGTKEELFERLRQSAEFAQWIDVATRDQESIAGMLKNISKDTKMASASIVAISVCIYFLDQGTPKRNLHTAAMYDEPELRKQLSKDPAAVDHLLNTNLSGLDQPDTN